jgi:hypothetical protein
VRGAGQRTLDCPFPLLNKPYGFGELAQAIRALLDQRDDPSEQPNQAEQTMRLERV